MKRLFLLLALVLPLILTASPNQRTHLTALYHALDGPNWDEADHWLDPVRSVCEWWGVGCDGAGRVTQLVLRFNRLEGELPDELFALTDLQRLDLSGNRLSGPLPEAIGNLSGLDSLAVRLNRLDGPLPASLEDLSTLSFLDLRANDFSGPLPERLWLSGNLRRALLSRNDFSGCLPPALLSFRDRPDNRLFLDRNPRLPWMGNVELAGGRATDQTGAPCSLPDRNVTRGRIDENCQCQPARPPECGHPDFPALDTLYHRLDGPNWSVQTGWIEGDCDPCRWTGVTCNAAGRVTDLKLVFARLRGELPAAIGDLEFLETLALEFNDLTGELPRTLLRLERLRVLNLWGTNFSGTLPDWLFQLPDLNYLDLRQNDFSGCVPDDFLTAAADPAFDLRLGGNPRLPYGGDITPLTTDPTQIGEPCGQENNPRLARGTIGADCNCVETDPRVVQGRILRAGSRQPQAGVRLRLLQADTVRKSVITGPSGNFRITFLEADTYPLLLEFNKGGYGGLTVLDQVLLLRYILGLQDLDLSQRMAADLNLDGSIDILDLVVLRRKLLRIDPAFPPAESWIFTVEDYDLPGGSIRLDGTTMLPQLTILTRKRGDLDDSY